MRAEEQWVQRENRTLLAAGFEPTYEENDLWIKDGVWFGRKAALQRARQTPTTASPNVEVYNK